MNRRYFRVGGVLLAALVLIAVVGALTGGNDSSGGTDEAALFDVDDGGVAGSIEAALGRDASVKQTQPDARAVAPAVPPVTGESARSNGGATSAADGGGLVAANTAAAIDDRKIVQTATIKLQVDDVGDSFAEVGQIATAAGGFVASSNFALQGEHQIATATIRVPADQYQAVLSQIRDLGAKVDAEGSNASDVTEEYSDLTARIRNLEATELRLLELLGRAANVNEILQVQDRITSTRAEIERLQGRINLLDKLSELATITVSLRPVVAPSSNGGSGLDLGEEVRQAWEDSLEFLGGIAAGVVSVLVFSWWIVLLAIPAALVLQRWSKSRPAPDGARYD